MPRLSIPASASNPYVDRLTVCDGYELCARCGQPILNGESAFVMWRSPQYGAFAHTFKCRNNSPRNWTKILKYEQVNETLAWNSQRVPEITTPLNVQTALLTETPEARSYQYERVMQGPNRFRKNRFEWSWTPGDPNWKRIDHWNEKGEWVAEGKIENDFFGGSSTITIDGRAFPFVSLLDWNHIQSACNIVDVNLSLEFPAKYPGLGEEHDGIPSDEKVRQRTAVAIHDDDGGTEGSGLTAVTRRIVCENREEKKMLDRLKLHPHNHVVETLMRKVQGHRTENARSSVGAMSFAYRPELYVPRPECVRVMFSKPSVTRALERIIHASTIRKERARSYSTGRVVKPDELPCLFTTFAKDLGRKPMESEIRYRRRPKVSGNGPGVAQSWDVFGGAVEFALYCASTVRIRDDGKIRLATFEENLEWELRQRGSTLSDVPSFKSEGRGWSRLLTEQPGCLLALVNWWLLNTGASAGESDAFDRPWMWAGRETDVFASLTNGGWDNPILPASAMASPMFVPAEGA